MIAYFRFCLPDENTCVLAKNASTIVSEILLICILYWTGGLVVHIIHLLAIGTLEKRQG